MVRKFLVIIFCALFLAIGINGVYKTFNIIPDIQKNDDEENLKSFGRVNIAFMGIDERSDDAGRTDTLFVVMYDPKNEKVALVSVPRDTRVRIPNHGWDKINHAYFYGGIDGTVGSLEQFLGINIDYYVKLDFKGFVHMIDAIDGVEIDIEKRMYYEDPWDDDGLVIDLRPGIQKLDGQQAIEYVRYRDEDGDIGRVERQQKFINVVYEKILSPNMLTKIPGLVKVAFESVDTNMSMMEMLKIGRVLQKNNKADLHAFSVPGEPIYIEEVSYWFPDVVTVRAEIADIMGMKNSKNLNSSAQKLARAYEDSLPYYVEREGFVYTKPATIMNNIPKDRKNEFETNKKEVIEGLESEDYLNIEQDEQIDGSKKDSEDDSFENRKNILEDTIVEDKKDNIEPTLDVQPAKEMTQKMHAFIDFYEDRSVKFFNRSSIYFEKICLDLYTYIR